MKAKKTGSLNLIFNDKDFSEQKQHYVWFRKGNIVAASEFNDGSGLISIIKKKKLLTQDIIDYKNNVYANDAPLGLALKNNGFLDTEELKILFYSQVLRKVCDLFQLQDANFEFKEGVSLPFEEMTGLSSPGKELTLAGLRALRDWSGLISKLPQEDSALMNNIEGEPKIGIHKLEKKVWNLSDGETTIKHISQQLEISLEKTQEIGFRLIAIGLAEEIPMVTMMKVEPETLEEEVTDNENSDLSESFLSSLMGFLTEV